MPENKHNKALKLFYSYSHKDKSLRDELETHLAIMKRQGLIESWSDRMITPGDEWKKRIDENLNSADIILLLVSADFLASDYCYDIEMKRALERHDKGEAVVIPIIIRNCNWQSAPFGKLLALPEDGKPVWRSSKNSRDSAWLEVVDGIEKVIRNFVRKAEQPETKQEEEKTVDKKEEIPTKEKDTEAKRIVATKMAEDAVSGYPQQKDNEAKKIEVITPQKTLVSLPKEIIGADGAPMVLIPAGEFEMGSDYGRYDDRYDEKPVHTVYLDAFYMDVYEVTNEQYKKFMDATRHKAPKYWNDERFNKPKHPVVGVSWRDAKAYADWAGKRLPTEAEWEKSARGGLVGKKYPCGDEFNHDHANYAGIGGKDAWEWTSPVGSFEPNGYGLYDMAGNVWEWCADLYNEDYYKNSPRQNPKGNFGVCHVMRGNSWNEYFKTDLRVSYRSGKRNPTFVFGDDVGFRCAMTI